MLLLRIYILNFAPSSKRANSSRQFVIPSFPSLHFKFRYNTIARSFARSKAVQIPRPGENGNSRSDTAEGRHRENRYCDIAILIANRVE